MHPSDKQASFDTNSFVYTATRMTGIMLQITVNNVGRALIAHQEQREEENSSDIYTIINKQTQTPTNNFSMGERKYVLNNY